MSEITLQIEGMHCGACVRRVTQALQNASESGKFTVDAVSIGEAKLNFATVPADTAIVLSALSTAGYPASIRQ